MRMGFNLVIFDSSIAVRGTTVKRNHNVSKDKIALSKRYEFTHYRSDFLFNSSNNNLLKLCFFLPECH